MENQIEKREDERWKDPEHQQLLQWIMTDTGRCTRAMRKAGLSLIWNFINSVMIIALIIFICLFK